MAIGKASGRHSGRGFIDRMTARPEAEAARGVPLPWGRTALAALALLSLVPSASTAATSRTTASASVVAPVSLGKAADLNFGAVDPSHVKGTVALGTDGLRWAGGAGLPKGPKAVVAAFMVSGEPNSAFTITLPKRVVLAAGDAGLQVTDFAHDAGGAPTLDGTGAQHFRIGAVLRAGPSLAQGAHVATFNVTVSWD
jgi:hypothetical protein